MMKKNILALALALILALSAYPALAAPTRDIQVMEVTADEKLQTLVNIACAAIPEECYGDEACVVLEAGDAPGADLTAQALWAAVLTTRETTWLSGAEAQSMYRQLFSQGAFEPAALSESPFVKMTEDGLEVQNITEFIASSRAYIYSAEFDGTDVLVKCDLYACEVEGADVDVVSEALLTWTNNAEISLRFAPETEFGYTVNSIALSPYYRDGNFGHWCEVENWDLEYSVNIPGSLEIADETTDHWMFRNIEGDVTLTIEALENNLSYDQALAQFMQAHPGREVKQERLYDAFTSMDAGEFILVVTADDYPFTYTVTLTFPKERQAEFEFYAEIIRNSFGVWGLSRG